ncbi:MAG: hypothetical protein AAF666_09610, partial [Pseudomonadota bacterium]
MWQQTWKGSSETSGHQTGGQKQSKRPLRRDQRDVARPMEDGSDSQIAAALRGREQFLALPSARTLLLSGIRPVKVGERFDSKLPRRIAQSVNEAFTMFKSFGAHPVSQRPAREIDFGFAQNWRCDRHLQRRRCDRR